jgi:tetratricopeptide (TPR) repeat protein
MKQRQPRPVLPDEVTGAELDRSVRQELSTLHSAVAKAVSRHLVMAGRLLDDDPETAYLHAAAAREQAARVASVREAVGLAAYRSGRFAEALTELRTARRLTGSNVHLPLMADCERGLGRPDRALALTQSDEARQLDAAGRVELMIVEAGARSDLGEPEAAVVVLQRPELQSTAHEPWVARLRSAYSDALSAVGRHEEARHWLELAAEADHDGETGAAERLAELDGLVLVDLEEDDDEDDGDEAPAPDEAPGDDLAPDVSSPGDGAPDDGGTGDRSDQEAR